MAPLCSGDNCFLRPGVYDGFVMAGRSLREVEKNEAQTEMFAVATWLITLIVVFVVIVLGEFLLHEKNYPPCHLTARDRRFSATPSAPPGHLPQIRATNLYLKKLL